MDELEVKVGDIWISNLSNLEKTIKLIDNDIVYFECVPDHWTGQRQGWAQPLNVFIDLNHKKKETLSQERYIVYSKLDNSIFTINIFDVQNFKHSTHYVVGEKITLNIEV